MKQSDSATPNRFRRYKSVPLNAVFDIPKIYTVHYFEYDCNYVFKGESHDFWEILFVDYGSVEVTVENRSMVLEKGSLLFHQPNEFHALRAIGKNPPNLIVVSFDCDSPHMDVFREKLVQAEEAEIQILGKITEEATNLFCQPLVSPLRIRGDAPFGSEQVLKMYLELFLITLHRRLAPAPESQLANPLAAESGNHVKLMEQVIAYLEDRVYQNLTVADICRDNSISKSLLQNIFHDLKCCGVIEYFNRMKIDTAKKLIRENRYTYSQIAYMLSYSSYQYFSLQFKKYTRMSPSEYHSSSQRFH